ncbi:MAG: AAA family ATPase [Saprospiraceae bacterium]|nr:AAA family ATPase [Saprospiraceae bacterium]
MLRSIQLQNFMSFGSTAKPIMLNSDSNLLVGINGSGKSNFLKAIQLLTEGVREKGGFQRLLSKWGGFDAVANYSGVPVDKITLTFEFDAEIIRALESSTKLFSANPFYKIEINKVGNNSYYLKEEVYAAHAGGEGTYKFLQMSNGAGFISEKSDSGGAKLSRYIEPSEVFDGQELVMAQAIDPKRFHPLYALKKAIEKISVYSYFDTTQDSIIRRMGEYEPDSQLKQDGSNLTQFLQRLSINAPLVFDDTIKWLKRVNPFFKDIRFDYLGKHFALVLTEERLRKPITLEGISDGTLRFYYCSPYCLTSERKLICIDEPEISLTLI